MTETHYAVLIRHGDYHQRSGVPSARQPFPLTETGRAQARACADNLAEMLQKAGLSSPPLLYCSRQLRAWETASLIAERLEALGLGRPEIQQSSDLAERGLGSAANLTAAEIETILREDPRYDPAPKGWKSDSDYRLPLEGAESLMEAGQRVAQHLNTIRNTTPPGQVAVHVGHGASFRHACYHLNLLSREEIAAFSMFHARPLLFCYRPHDKWSHLTGAWKIRAAKDDPID